MTKKQPFYVAVHEAGHAAAEWLLGGFPASVQIKTNDAPIIDRRNRARSDIAGLFEGSMHYDVFTGHPPAHSWLKDEELLRNSRRYGLAAAIITLAGSYAESRYRHIYCLYLLISADDYIREFKKINNDLFAGQDQQNEFERKATNSIKKLLRGRIGSIVQIAEVVHAHGRLCDEKPIAVLTENLGEQPACLDWWCLD